VHEEGELKSGKEGKQNESRLDAKSGISNENLNKVINSVRSYTRDRGKGTFRKISRVTTQYKTRKKGESSARINQVDPKSSKENSTSISS